jgi:hypothetical protein
MSITEALTLGTILKELSVGVKTKGGRDCMTGLSVGLIEFRLSGGGFLMLFRFSMTDSWVRMIGSNGRA